jgi:effector-binding domain-containing protein
MKKKVIVILLLVVVFAACFITVPQQKTISVKAPFLNVFIQLVNPDSWKKWRPDINTIPAADSDKIIIRKDTVSFEINYGRKKLNVKSSGNLLEIKDNWGDKTLDYSYAIIPDKQQDKTSIIVYKKVFVINYLIGKISPASFDDTHINDLKKFMETDSLRYGFNIFKTKVPEDNLIEIKKEVLTKDQFTQAAKMLISLQLYVKKHNVKKTQPLIAQFLPMGKDSTQVNLGFYIDKKAIPENDIIFTTMPKGNTLYAISYKGRFDERLKAYTAMRQYFRDHVYQMSILPFESYLDDKLPASDSDHVNVQLNFASYF